VGFREFERLPYALLLLPTSTVFIVSRVRTRKHAAWNSIILDTHCFSFVYSSLARECRTFSINTMKRPSTSIDVVPVRYDLQASSYAFNYDRAIDEVSDQKSHNISGQGGHSLFKHRITEPNPTRKSLYHQTAERGHP
jgi:hypothetical protein